MRIHIDPLVADTFGWVFGARAFLDALERAIPEADRQEREAIRTQAKREQWDESDYSVAMDEITAKFSWWLPGLSAYSTVVLLHSLVETQLHAFAKRMKHDQSLALSISDLRGSPIDCAHTYLTKVASVDIGRDPGWEELRNLQKLRDLVIHRRGVPPDDQRKAEVERLLNRYKGDLRRADRLNFEGEIEISFALCRRFVDEVETFFRRVFKAAGLPDDGITAEP
jgi:hypothetical protein